MTNKVSRFSKSILQEPQLMALKEFTEVSDYLNSRGSEDYIKAHEEATLLAEKNEQDNPVLDLAETNVGLLRIEGALTYKPTIFQALCGGASYIDLIDQTKQLCAMDDIDTIVMQVDSGGGAAFRMMESARQIKELCNESGKRLICYVDGSSGSAAYGLSSVADEVIVNPDSMVGSIGVVVSLTDTSKQEEKEGLRTIFITAGDSKVPFNEDGEFKKEYLDDVQERVDELYVKFVDHVATNRNLSTEAVRNTQAKMFSAEKALELGLVDKIMEGEEFHAYLSELSNKEEQVTPSRKVNVVTLETQEDPMSMENNMSTEKTQEAIEASVDVGAAQLAELAAMKEQLADFAAMKEQLSSYQAKEEASAKAELSASLDAYAFLGDNKENLVAFLSDGAVSKEHKELMQGVLSGAQASFTEVSEAAAGEIAKAEENAEEAVKLAEQAELAKEAVKEEFSTEQHSVEAKGETLTHTQMLRQKVQEQKAAKAAKA